MAVLTVAGTLVNTESLCAFGSATPGHQTRLLLHVRPQLYQCPIPVPQWYWHPRLRPSALSLIPNPPRAPTHANTRPETATLSTNDWITRPDCDYPQSTLLPWQTGIRRRLTGRLAPAGPDRGRSAQIQPDEIMIGLGEKKARCRRCPAIRLCEGAGTVWRGAAAIGWEGHRSDPSSNEIKPCLRDTIVVYSIVR